MKISLVNPVTNQIKRAKIGFSWTTFFFGFWPAIFRIIGFGLSLCSLLRQCWVSVPMCLAH